MTADRELETQMETQIHLEPDLHVAGYLLARGFALLGLERVGRRFAFQFSPEAHEAAQEYRHGTTIEARLARDYADALKLLKNQLFAEKFKEETRNEDRNGNNVYRNYR